MHSKPILNLMLIAILGLLHAACPETKDCVNCLPTEYYENGELCKRCDCLTDQDIRDKTKSFHCPHFGKCPEDCKLSAYDGCYACVCS
jgi:hypothetical protein